MTCPGDRRWLIPFFLGLNSEEIKPFSPKVQWKEKLFCTLKEAFQFKNSKEMDLLTFISPLEYCSRSFDMQLVPMYSAWMICVEQLQGSNTSTKLFIHTKSLTFVVVFNKNWHSGLKGWNSKWATNPSIHLSFHPCIYPFIHPFCTTEDM